MLVFTEWTQPTTSQRHLLAAVCGTALGWLLETVGTQQSSPTDSRLSPTTGWRTSHRISGGRTVSLIATDVLSGEGQNLQDAHIVVN